MPDRTAPDKLEGIAAFDVDGRPVGIAQGIRAGSNVTLEKVGRFIVMSASAGGGGSPLNVREEDGSPSDAAVTIVRVPNGGLVSNAAGDVSLVYALSAHGHAHGALSGVTANQHHAQSHAHNGADGSGTIDHGALTGLTDDDHTQYVLRSILTTKGDVFVRTASGIVRLPVGANGQVLQADAAETAGVKWAYVVQSKTITLETPSASEDIVVETFQAASTITYLRAVIKGGTSVTINPVHGTDRSAAGTALLSSALVVNSKTTAQEVTSFASAAVPAGGILRLKTTALSGVVQELSVTFGFRVT